MKCSVCGSKNMFEVSIIDNQVLATEGYVRQTVKSYACEDCGHIDLYMPKEKTDKNTVLRRGSSGSILGG